MSPRDALRAALVEVIARERQVWGREREVIEAQARAAIAEMRAESATLRAEREAERAEFRARMEEMIAARLLTLRDGQDGTPGERGPQGEPGPPGPAGEKGPQGERGADGRDGIDGAPGRDGADGVAGRDGVDGKDGRDGVDGSPGERGPEGPPGKLARVRAWTDGVHYEGDVVTHRGSVWQALRDTGREPPGDDWLCIVVAGADGRAMTFRGAWSADETYEALDVAMLNGSSFVAVHDAPGECPGAGWRLLAAAGTKGRPGERGPTGPAGERGPAGPAVRSLVADDEGLLTLTLADGTTVEGDLYPLLSKIAHS